MAVATISAVKRVRRVTRVGSILEASVMPPLWDDRAAEESRKQPVDRETVEPPGADAAWKRCRHGDLDKRCIG